jgi:uncharacterized membrane protein
MLASSAWIVRDCMWSLIGIPLLVAGLAIRLNPILVVTAAAFAAGLGGGLEPLAVLRALGKAFNDARYISLAFLVLPVIGLAERSGLQARSQALIGRLRGLTVGRLLLGYLVVRQVSAAAGLLSLGGQASMVRPVLAPMAEGVAKLRHGELGVADQVRIRAHAAAADTIGAFFGEDIFVALGAVLLVQGVLQGAGLTVRTASIALWAAPTGVAALVIHGVRLLWLDRTLPRAPLPTDPGRDAA